jgi:hypothetical protein
VEKPQISFDIASHKLYYVNYQVGVGSPPLAAPGLTPAGCSLLPRTAHTIANAARSRANSRATISGRTLAANGIFFAAPDFPQQLNFGSI